MIQLPNEIFRRWIHSFEEDKDETTVYRPDEYDFPPSRRGREGIEFRPDGVFVDWEIGPNDAFRGINGHWTTESAGSVRIFFEGNVREPRIMEILQIDAKVLKVRQQSAA